MIDLGSNRVSKIMAGTHTVYQDSGGWIPLKLPDGVSGYVMFKDNGDRTASLIGTLAYTSEINNYTSSAPGHLMLTPPIGYKFVSTPWSIPKYSEIGMSALSGTNSTGPLGQISSVYLSFDDGNLSSTVATFYNGNTKPTAVISFNQQATNKSCAVADYAKPAIINIEKI